MSMMKRWFEVEVAGLEDLAQRIYHRSWDDLEEWQQARCRVLRVRGSKVRKPRTARADRALNQALERA